MQRQFAFGKNMRTIGHSRLLSIVSFRVRNGDMSGNYSLYHMYIYNSLFF